MNIAKSCSVGRGEHYLHRASGIKKRMANYLLFFWKKQVQGSKRSWQKRKDDEKHIGGFRKCRKEVGEKFERLRQSGCDKNIITELFRNTCYVQKML
jgi:hypothetical protein